MALKTDYKDDVLDTSVNEKRVYNLVDQSGNTVMSGLSLEDMTVYLQTGDSFGAQELNEINSDLALIDSRAEVTDLIAEADKGKSARRIVLTVSGTLNTPYTEGLTGNYNSGVAYINMVSPSYGEILYCVSGKNQIFTKYKNGGTWGNWDKITLNSDLAQQVLTFTDIAVTTSAWKSSSNEDFPYYADVTCSGVTTSHVPNVNFSLADANSGIFSTVCESRSGAVRIYASEKPTATVTIPTIQCIKSV